MALIELLQLISVFLIPAVISYFVYKKLKFNKYVNLIILYLFSKNTSFLSASA